MNQSGLAVQALVQFYKVPVERVLIVLDDADLPLGTVLVRPGGGTGGHHGLESIEQHLGTHGFARLRIGIGRRAEGEREITNHVLGRFDEGEWPLLKASLERVCDQIECWVSHGPSQAMNQFNGTINTPQVKES
jgi:peptidyl-tRNA hydrolase, PTH1 family